MMKHDLLESTGASIAGTASSRLNHGAQGVASAMQRPFAARSLSADAGGPQAQMLNGAIASGSTHKAQFLLRLQREHGNRYVQRVLAQRQCACGGRGDSCSCHQEPNELQRFAPPPAPGSMSGGRPLHPAVQMQMEQGFGRDFGDVRVHEEVSGIPRPKEVGAEAFTIGNDVVVGRQMREEADNQDRSLLAHELAHVVQQHSAPMLQTKSFASDDSPLEVEADRASAAVLSGQQATVHLEAGSSGGGPQAGAFSAAMCGYYMWKYSSLLDECRAEYHKNCDEDLLSDSCSEWMDGTGFPSDAIMHCAGRKNPTALKAFLKWCSKTATGSYGNSKYTTVDPSDSGAVVPGLAADSPDPAPAPADPNVVAQAEQTGNPPDGSVSPAVSPEDDPTAIA